MFKLMGDLEFHTRGIRAPIASNIGKGAV